MSDFIITVVNHQCFASSINHNYYTTIKPHTQFLKAMHLALMFLLWKEVAYRPASENMVTLSDHRVPEKYLITMATPPTKEGDIILSSQCKFV